MTAVSGELDVGWEQGLSVLLAWVPPMRRRTRLISIKVQRSAWGVSDHATRSLEPQPDQTSSPADRQCVTKDHLGKFNIVFLRWRAGFRGSGLLDRIVRSIQT